MAPKIVVAVLEKVKEGATLAQVKEAWKMVADASAKVPGMLRFQSSWNEEQQRAMITEVFDSPEDYLAFFSNIDMKLIQPAIEFLDLNLVCSRAHLPGFGDLIKNFAFKVFLTDECPGENKLAPTSNSKLVVTAMEAIKEGHTLEEAKALWAHVSEAAAKVRGAKRFQSSWNDELKQGLITEIFDTPEDYMAFFSHVDTSKMACIDFKGITISCSRADLPALDSLLSGFPFQVFLTDGCAGDEKMY